MEPSFLPNLQDSHSSTNSDKSCSTACTADAAHSLVTKVGLICTMISFSRVVLLLDKYHDFFFLLDKYHDFFFFLDKYHDSFFLLDKYHDFF